MITETPSLLTEFFSSPSSVSQEGGCVPIYVAVLDSAVCRDMRPCFNCAGEKVFVEVYEIAGVCRVGVCLGCGEERRIWLTRVSGE